MKQKARRRRDSLLRSIGAPIREPVPVRARLRLPDPLRADLRVEFAAGIQPNIVSEIGDILMQLNREEGITLLLVEQKLPFARKVASRFCVMDRGRSVATGEMRELTDELVSQHLTV